LIKKKLQDFKEQLWDLHFLMGNRKMKEGNKREEVKLTTDK